MKYLPRLTPRLGERADAENALEAVWKLINRGPGYARTVGRDTDNTTFDKTYWPVNNASVLYHLPRALVSALQLSGRFR